MIKRVAVLVRAADIDGCTVAGRGLLVTEVDYCCSRFLCLFCAPIQWMSLARQADNTGTLPCCLNMLTAVFLYENIGDAVAHLAHNQSQFTGYCL